MTLFSKLKDLLQHNDEIKLELDDIQATVLRERPDPYFGTHALVKFDTAAGGRELLKRLLPHILSASKWWEVNLAWVAVGLSYKGLEALGVPQDSLDSFPDSFKYGMAARAEHLYDLNVNAPEHWEAPFGQPDVHLAISIFAMSEQNWKKALEMAEQKLAEVEGVTVLLRDNFGAQPDSRNSLGYKDMISNPAIEGSGIKPFAGQGPAIKAGEFILGYPTEAGVLLPMPQPEVLGKNGTFIALRKYHTNAGSFNAFLKKNAQATGGDLELLAAKLVGRWRSGAPLSLAPDQDNPELGRDPERNNDFTYQDDSEGLKVPHGAHMRRMNPRDSKLEILTDVNIHRIIRRATAFGPAYDPEADTKAEDQVDRGLYFIFISAKAMDTLEFLQKEWINKANFIGQGSERDPIVGLQEDTLTFTLPEQPVRQRMCGMATFNELRGGEYLFMPSLSALKWLSELQ